MTKSIFLFFNSIFNQILRTLFENIKVQILLIIHRRRSNISSFLLIITNFEIRLERDH